MLYDTYQWLIQLLTKADYANNDMWTLLNYFKNRRLKMFFDINFLYVQFNDQFSLENSLFFTIHTICDNWTEITKSRKTKEKSSMGKVVSLNKFSIIRVIIMNVWCVFTMNANYNTHMNASLKLKKKNHLNLYNFAYLFEMLNLLKFRAFISLKIEWTTYIIRNISVLLIRYDASK